MEQSISTVATDNRLQCNEEEYYKLPFEDKRAYLASLPPTDKIELILNDPEAKKLIRAMLPQELYWLFKEIDVADAMELLGVANPRQCVFILDMELWRGWALEEDKAVEYLGYILKGSDEHFIELLPHLDFNLLSLFLGRELIVTGGVGDLNTDEERQTDWDHTFDDLFLIKFKNQKHAQIIGSFLELVCRYDNRLYVALMESVSGEIDTESEEECYHLKSGRLADLGFPPYDEALEIYSRINPETFIPGCDKVLIQSAESTSLPRTVVAGNTFLEQVILLVDSDLFRMELNYLINTALVADQAHLADTDYMRAVVERVYGYLNIALEYLCNGDQGKGAEILTGEHLKRLFQLGFSIVLGLKLRADRLSDETYATGKALSGLKSARPLYYRGFDSDGIDGYREFRDLEDIQRMSDFLTELKG
ncbi:hypothetical protein SAMN02745119_01198 [Trichlorobacter thiogenes]|uniref:Uncharacterized protein n=1 Tax=Trichlorobacter thiogenes TaxID=115783 RepID=A0A1T4M737_9BACT|nr:DUF6178 family protein [Trichlorobacter thiogenes]SJZ62732.1 hypothetical protein SAMN02745119_01198 [Trichlorobacter thiogenes]